MQGTAMSTKSTQSKLSAGVLIALILALNGLGGMGVHAGSVMQSTATMAATEEPCPRPAGDTTLKATLPEYTLPTANSQPYGIAAGPDGALWFGEGNGNNIGRITTDGKITEYPFLVIHNDQHFVAAGPDGAVWFTDDFQNKIGRISLEGKITEYAIPSGVSMTDDNGTAYTSSNPRGLVIGSDKALWFTEGSTSKI